VIAAAVFYGTLAVVAWVYAGYALVLWATATLRGRPVRKAPIEPKVSMIICAYNEAQDIRRKLEETLALDYPPDKLEVIVASDGSTDGTEAIVREFAPRVRLLAIARRGGKTSAQNAAVQIATGDILLFSDVTTVYPKNNIRAIVANFADPDVGCVSGDLIYLREAENPSGEGRALFWNYERQMRIWESQVHSLIGTTGCCCAMRRKLYVPLPPDTISDFVEPGLITQRGWRTVLEVGAPAYERAESGTLRTELHRRARVITRGLRGAFCMPDLLNPLRHPWFAIELWSHRVLRWLSPLLLVVLLIASIPLAVSHGGIYRLALVGQLSVYGAGIVAWALERARVRLPGTFIPLYFCLIHLAPLLALTWLARGEKKVVWETGR
jgi:cellulose synthase/poly-beta-1,6-N-acetylglucosamine synthase-like glycosyltransferase